MSAVLEGSGRPKGEWLDSTGQSLPYGRIPVHAASRIMRTWAGIAEGSPRLLAVESEVMPTGIKTGSGRARHALNHWALCFVYGLRTNRRPKTPRAWAELKFVSVRKLRTIHIGRNHGDLLFPNLKA